MPSSSSSSPRSPRARRWLALLLPLLPLALWAARPRDPEAHTLRLTVIDVGQGDSLLIQTPSGHTVLVDGGGADDSGRADRTDVGERVVVPFLHHQGIDQLDFVVLTHPHGDHVGGLPAVLREERVGRILDGTVLPYPAPFYQEFLAEASRRQIPRTQAVRGMHLDFGDGVTADVLNPTPGTPYGTTPDNATVNNYSVVLRLSYGKTHFLLNGDAQSEAERSMAAAYPDLRADVLKAGHHGAGNATGDAWLDRVRPRWAAISCGAHNRFGHPNAGTLARLAAHGVSVQRTDRDGGIEYISDGRTVRVRPSLERGGG